MRNAKTDVILKVFNYSSLFNNEIEVLITQADYYWDSNYPESRVSKIRKSFNLKNNLIITPHQIHSDKVVSVSKDTDPCLACDGIIYNLDSDIVGTINVADCIPICIFDASNKNIALIHSGWRGTHKKIVLNAINQLIELGSDLKKIKIFLGPSIKGCCYEVDQDFSSKFDPYAVRNYNGKYFVDLANQVKFDLESISIPSNNIFVDQICTYDSLECHSYRRDGDNAGRMTLIVYRRSLK